MKKEGIIAGLAGCSMSRFADLAGFDFQRLLFQQHIFQLFRGLHPKV